MATIRDTTGEQRGGSGGEQQVSRLQWDRYSGRQHTKHPLSGLVGQAVVTNIPDPLWPYLVLGQCSGSTSARGPASDRAVTSCSLHRRAGFELAPSPLGEINPAIARPVEPAFDHKPYGYPPAPSARTKTKFRT